MPKAQRTCKPEFKRQAVRLAQTGGKPIAQIACELDISDTSTHSWRKELRQAVISDISTSQERDL